MTAVSPTLGQIKALVTSVQQKHARARVIGIHSPGRWTGTTDDQNGEPALVIRQCDSPLAIRLALREQLPEGTTKVLVTPLEMQDLSDDILVRLATRKLRPINTWEIVRSLFQARAIDPRVAQHRWIADALLEEIPTDGYPAARGGFLDAETVWPLLLRQRIGLDAEVPDLTSLLKWSRDAVGTERYRSCSEEFRTAAVEWLTEQAGPAAGLLLRCVTQLERPDAVPVGLAAAVVFQPAAAGKLERAATRLEERYFGGETPDAQAMLRWSTGATEVVRGLRHTEPKVQRQVLQRADEILREVQAEAFAHLSDTSILGFEQRLRHFGALLAETVNRRYWIAANTLQAARDAVQASDQSSDDIRRLERADMSLRLVRWLGQHEGTGRPAPKSLAEAATGYLREGGFVDWARLRLRSGDQDRELSDAYAKLFTAVSAIQEQQAQQFGHLLADWTAAGSRGSDVIPVEQILERIVAPLASASPVLLVVIDGMSVAVCRELLADLTRQDWFALCEEGHAAVKPGLATIPSWTECSRTSLLCGRLVQGGQADEQAGFAAHPALLPHCRNGSPPMLYHKVALQEAGEAGLPGKVREGISSSHRRVVGVVINAVDDHLAKGEQLDTRWTRDEIKVLPALLHEARSAGRIVVLVSDHGHVLDYGTKTRTAEAEGGARWRVATGQPAADELLATGDRVLVKGGRLIAPWSELVRYGGKQNGYHGGLSPQEMVVPIAVLSPIQEPPPGWQVQPVDIPAWWDEPSVDIAPAAPAKVVKAPKPPPKGKLFDVEAEAETEIPALPVESASARPDWIARLLACEVYLQQRQLAGRNVPDDELVGRLLGALDGRGGKMTTIALARALEFPEVRLPGLIAKVQRMLNVDGYAVLNRDDASNTIELNRELLVTQFDLM